jgi:hypothetical protein
MSSSKVIATNSLQLYPTVTASPLVLNSGSTRFSFEMPLPAGIPETIHCPQVKVNYTMTVSIDYQRSATSSMLQHQVEKQIILARLPESGMLAGENYPYTIDSHKHFSQWCQYRITIDTKSAALGSKLPVKIEIAPTVKELKLKQVFLQLLEKRMVTPELDGVERSVQSIYFLYPAKGSKMVLPIKPLISNWEGQCLYQIPDDKSICHSTQTYSHFRVNHVLLVSLVVSLPDTKANQQYTNDRYSTRTLSFQTQIDLLDSHVSQLGERDKLPCYNCPISIEEMEKLNSHGLSMEYPPTYEESILLTNV